MNELLSQNVRASEQPNSQVEYVAVFDKYNQISFQERSAAMNPENEYKRIIVGMFLTTRDQDDNEYIILQRRSENKKEFPNHLALTAAGHINPIDVIENKLDYSSALAREMDEEIGMTLPDGINIVSSFESVEHKPEDKDIRKEIVLGLANVDIDRLTELVINEELSGLEIFRLQEIIDLIYSDNKNEKFTTPTEQSIKHLVETGIFPKPTNSHVR